ncbi:hypothetical protein LDENG_00025910 [Lucifuga dentata]|nr:hypothetical protein LDENG_00025910 [Lucifuga dentata]
MEHKGRSSSILTKRQQLNRNTEQVPLCRGLSEVTQTDTTMMKAGATKVGLPKPGFQERAKQASLAPSSTTTNSTAMKTSRSSNTLASDQRLSRLKRANSDDALTKPALGAAASGSRMKKTITTGAISDLAEGRSRSLSGAQAGKKSDREQEEVSEALLMVGELREKNGKFQRELAALREENQVLKEKLLCLETSPLSSTNTSTPSKSLVNGLPSDSHSSASQQDSVPPTDSPLKTSVSSSSNISKESPSPDSSGFEKIPSYSESIHKMEENHHSTAEELQATLQELADQQQVVQELTAENERLTEEKRLLQTSLQQQRERLELLAQKNEALAARLQEQAQAQAQREEHLGSQGPRLAELEQRYAELVESSRFEREKLVDIQQQLTSSLRALEQEHQEAQGQVHCLREEMDRLQIQLDGEQEAGRQAAQTAEEQRATADCLRLENSRLKAQVDIEKQKVAELKTVQNASDSTELQSLLKTAHAERDKLGVELTELRQELLQAQAETEHTRATISKMEAKCQQLQERAERREQELSGRVSSLEESGVQAENQVKELKETIFELEDQVEQQRAINLHTNQTVLDLENFVKKLEEQKAEAERQLKVYSRKMKDEKEEWRRFQADLQTAVVVANDIKVEAQQELRSLRKQLQEEQHRSAKLSSDLEALQGVRSQADEVRVSDSDNGHHWCSIAMIPTTPTEASGSDNGRHWCSIAMIPTTPTEASGDAASEPGATVKSLIKSFDTVEQNGPTHTVQMHSSPRSPLSGIPVRTAPAAAVSPIQRQSYIKPLSKTLEKRINHGEFSHHHDKLSGCREGLKPNNLMRKSPSLESVIKSSASLNSRTASFSYNRANSKLS